MTNPLLEMLINEVESLSVYKTIRGRSKISPRALLLSSEIGDAMGEENQYFKCRKLSKVVYLLKMSNRDFNKIKEFVRYGIETTSE